MDRFEYVVNGSIAQCDKGSFHLYVLPYMEQENLFKQVAAFDLYTPRVDTITRAIYHDAAGNLVGIEILDASRRVTEARSMEFEVAG